MVPTGGWPRELVCKGKAKAVQTEADFCWWAPSRVTVGVDSDSRNRCQRWSRSAETCHCLRAAKSDFLWKDTLKQGWFPTVGGCNRASEGTQGDAASPALTGGVVLARPVHLWDRRSCWSPPQHPQCVPSACHQTKERWRRPGSPHPAAAGSERRLWVLSTLRPMPGSPETPQQIPCLAVMIYFSRMKSALLGSSQSPVVFGGSIQPSQAAWVLRQPVLEPGALTLSPSLPAASALPRSSCPSAAAMKPLKVRG